jgi:branched-chain amino acid transport system substrate-binding protein
MFHQRTATVALLLLPAILSSYSRAATEKTLDIGILFPLTGDAASYGEKGRAAIQLAIGEIHSAHSCGANRNVKVTFEDSAAKPDTGVSAFLKLVSADHVPVVIGDIVSSVTLAVAPLANRTETVLLSPTASAPALTHAGPYFYRIWPSDLEEGRAIANYAAQHGFKRVAVLYMNNDYGLAIHDIFAKTLASQGGEVVDAESYLETNQDFRSVLTKIKALKPDALYVAGYYADSGTIVRQARELGFSAPILGTTAIEDPKFLELAGPAAEGVVYPLATGFDADSTDPTVVKFVEAFKQRFHHTPGWVEAQAYDAMGVVCAGAAKIPDVVTGKELKVQFDHLGRFTGVTGSFEFDANGDVVKPLRLRTVKGGKFVNLEH